MRSSGKNNHCNGPVRVDDCDHKAQQSDCPNDNSEDISRVQIAPPAKTSASDCNSSKERIAIIASHRYRPPNPPVVSVGFAASDPRLPGRIVMRHSQLETRNRNAWPRRAATAHPNVSRFNGALG